MNVSNTMSEYAIIVDNTAAEGFTLTAYTVRDEKTLRNVLEMFFKDFIIDGVVEDTANEIEHLTLRIDYNRLMYIIKTRTV